jgi:glycosyltransferase involved in cell wall biosynthesis
MAQESQSWPRTEHARKIPLPIVTVILPVFNGEHFLRAAIESILKQTLHSLELIAIDDGSIDGSRAILDEYSVQDARVTVLANASNCGPGFSLYRATALARGKYVHWMGQDDVADVNFLATQVQCLDATDSIASFGTPHIIDAKGERISDLALFSHNTIGTTSRLEFFQRLLSGNFLCGPSAVFRRTAIELSFIGWNNDRFQDFEFWLNLACVGTFVRCLEATLFYRVHSSNFSVGGKQRQFQGRLEYSNAVLRALTSPAFEAFSSGYAPLDIALCVLNGLAPALSYSPPLAVIETAVVERIAVRIEDAVGLSIIGRRLAPLYQALGAYSKSYIWNANVLPRRIPALVLTGNAIVRSLISKSGVLVQLGTKGSNHGSGLRVLTGPLDRTVLSPATLDALREGHVIVFCSLSELLTWQAFPLVLCIEFDNTSNAQGAVGNIDRLILSHLEDKIGWTDTTVWVAATECLQ